jgi:hypothetical protein
MCLPGSRWRIDCSIAFGCHLGSITSPHTAIGAGMRFYRSGQRPIEQDVASMSRSQS